MMPLRVMKIVLKNPQKQMKKMKNGKSLMFIKHLVQMMMMMMTMMIIMVIHIIVVFDHGKNPNDKNNSIIHIYFFSSPDDGTLDSREQESKRKRCTPISTKDQLKSMILSRFRMEK
jgi:hypothetical protein